MKTVLVTVSDDRFGRKDGKYEETQSKINSLFIKNKKFGIDDHHIYQIKYFLEYSKNLTLELRNLLNIKDAARNGRVYKPLSILESLRKIDEGDFLIYTDCSPELWKNIPSNLEDFDIEIIKNLCIENNDILTAFTKWSDEKLLANGDLGKHTHKNFTLDRCMNRMDMKFYEDCYMHASGMWCIRKTKKTINIIEKWLYYNSIDECCSLGWSSIENDDSFWQKENHNKMGHRHDQSISGLLLNSIGQNFVDIIYNDLHPYNFLNFCRKDTEYKFISGNPKIVEGDKVMNKQGTIMKVWRIDIENNKERFIIGQLEESCYGTSRENLKLLI